MNKSDRLMLVTIFILIFFTMLLCAGIYQNTKSEEKHEIIPVNATIDLQPLIDAGYFRMETEGHSVEDNEASLLELCPFYKVLQSGNLTLTIDNWDRVVIKVGKTEVPLFTDELRGREE